MRQKTFFEFFLCQQPARSSPSWLSSALGPPPSAEVLQLGARALRQYYKITPANRVWRLRARLMTQAIRPASWYQWAPCSHP